MIVVGQGPTQQSLRKQSGPFVKFMDHVSQDDWELLLFHARGLIYPGVEDFGMVPIEAMALGTPVIAFNQGGARDYINHGVNGLFFNEHHSESLTEALKLFPSQTFDPTTISTATSKYSSLRFQKEMREHIDAVLKT